MRTIIRIIFFLSIGITVFFACDEIEEPFIEYQGDCGDASLPIPIKQILIEKFTGHKCGTCPGGDETMEMLKELYCDHIIPVSIHAGTFADVNTTGDMYLYDYKTEDGNTIDEYFEASIEVPSALINRKESGGDLTLSQSNWAIAIAGLLEEKPVLDIIIRNNFSSESRELNVDIDVVFVDAMNENLMLSVYYVEDSIVTWQKDYEANPNNVEFYSHNHVLRDAINGAWGDEILNGRVNANDIKNKSYKYTINAEWVVENSSIVAFVYNNDNKEVLQASQAYLIP